MGHLTLISEDVITALEHYPLDLREAILPSCPQPDWDEYVNGRYSEAKKRDTSLLGGGKPALTSGINRNASDWKVDEEDASANASSSSELRGTLNRNVSEQSPVNTADFGPAPSHEEDEDESTWPPTQVWTLSIYFWRFMIKLTFWFHYPKNSLLLILLKRCMSPIPLVHHLRIHPMTTKMRDGWHNHSTSNIRLHPVLRANGDLSTQEALT
jgi:hypothetical protein